MKSRVIYPTLWSDERIQQLTRLTRYLFVYLISNQFLSLTRYTRISDKQIIFDTDLNKDELQKSKDELQRTGLVFFYESWQFHNHDFSFFNYGLKEDDKSFESKNKELSLIPEEIINKISLLQGTLVPPLGVPLNPNINKIITHEDKGVLGEKEKAEKIGKTIEYLKAMPSDDLAGFVREYNVSDDQVAEIALQMLNYCLSKGKKYSDYKAAMHNWILRKYGKRLAVEPEDALSQLMRKRSEKK